MRGEEGEWAVGTGGDAAVFIRLISGPTGVGHVPSARGTFTSPSLARSGTLVACYLWIM